MGWTERLTSINLPFWRRGGHESESDGKGPFHEALVTTILWIVSLIVLASMLVLPFLMMLAVVPFLTVFALPLILITLSILLVMVPQLAYLLLAQDDAPPHVVKPFLLYQWGPILQVNAAVWRWTSDGALIGSRVIRDWILRKIKGGTYGVKLNILYGSPRPNKRLDVYTPTPLTTAPSPNTPPSILLPPVVLTPPDTPSAEDLRPVIVFFPPQIRPLPSQKVVFSSLGANMAEKLGVVAVVADICLYPEGRTREQAEDARLVLRWVSENIHKYGGDKRKIYLMGHGLGAHLALLLPIQAAVAKSRDDYLAANGKTTDIPNGVMDVRVYAQEVDVPDIAGLILLAPITNIDEHLVEETTYYTHHLSLVRRVLGPNERVCFLHSPAHLIYAARNMLNRDYLPPRILFIHGGLDLSIQHTQSESMKEILRGVGVPETKVLIYDVGHWDVVMSLMCDMEGPPIMGDLHKFVWPRPVDLQGKLRLDF